jgi:hypothetical protein
MNPSPKPSDIWCFYGLTANFYYLITEYTEKDPSMWDADTVTLLSLTKSEAPIIKEIVSKITANTKHWKHIA